MMAGTLKMMNGKRCRFVKVYRHIDSFYRCIPFIKLQGEWLRQLGFQDGDSIRVSCEEGKLTITTLDEHPIEEEVIYEMTDMDENDTTDCI